MVLHKHFFKILLKLSPYFIGGIILLLFVDYMQLEIPVRIGEIVNIFKYASKNNLTQNDIKGDLISFKDTILYQSSGTTIMPIILRLVFVVALICVGRIIWRFFIFGGSRAVEREIRNKMFSHATRLSQDYYSRNKVGAIMSLFTADLDALRNTYGPGTMQLVDGSFLLIMILYRMFKINLKLNLNTLEPWLWYQLKEKSWFFGPGSFRSDRIKRYILKSFFFDLD